MTEPGTPLGRVIVFDNGVMTSVVDQATGEEQAFAFTGADEQIEDDMYIARYGEYTICVIRESLEAFKMRMDGS